MSDELVAFLRARLNEDEGIARAAGERVDPDWGDDEEHVYSLPHGYPVAFGSADGCMHGELRAHIAEHDPARVLREIEAKRGLLALHRPSEFGTWVGDDDDQTPACRTCGDLTTRFPCRTLRLLALPYADHPDYRSEWTP